jgi:Ran GTPase-activating protein (RanGAP) involved in mRNA processing and transport
MRIVEDGLSSNTGLRTLDLSRNALATRDCEHLCDILIQKRKLRIVEYVDWKDRPAKMCTPHILEASLLGRPHTHNFVKRLLPLITASP